MRYLRRRGSAGLHGGAHRGRREGLRSRSENHTQSVSGDDETRISAWCASCAFFCGWSRASPVARPVVAVQGAGHPVKVLCCRSPRLSKAARRRRAFCRETIWAAEIVPFTLERMGAVASNIRRHERGPSFVRYSRGSGDTESITLIRKTPVFMINLLINLHI